MNVYYKNTWAFPYSCIKLEYFGGISGTQVVTPRASVTFWHPYLCELLCDIVRAVFHFGGGQKFHLGSRRWATFGSPVGWSLSPHKVQVWHGAPLAFQQHIYLFISEVCFRNGLLSLHVTLHVYQDIKLTHTINGDTLVSIKKCFHDASLSLSQNASLAVPVPKNSLGQNSFNKDQTCSISRWCILSKDKTTQHTWFEKRTTDPSWFWSLYSHVSNKHLSTVFSKPFILLIGVFSQAVEASSLRSAIIAVLALSAQGSTLACSTFTNTGKESMPWYSSENVTGKSMMDIDYQRKWALSQYYKGKRLF